MARRKGQRREIGLPVNRAWSQALFPAPLVHTLKAPAKLVPAVHLSTFSRLGASVVGSGQTVQRRAYANFSLSEPSPRSGRREAFTAPAVGTSYVGRTKGRELRPGCVQRPAPEVGQRALQRAKQAGGAGSGPRPFRRWC